VYLTGLSMGVISPRISLCLRQDRAPFHQSPPPAQGSGRHLLQV
jgi:hypothetical protein